MSKLTSRKLWISIASMLASIATSIAGLQSDNQAITIVGVICTVASAAIYAGCEAYIDASAVDAQIITLTDDAEEEGEEEP